MIASMNILLSSQDWLIYISKSRKMIKTYDLSTMHNAVTLLLNHIV